MYEDDLQQAQLQSDNDPLRIPINCEILSSYEDMFNDILEMDGLSQESIIESLDIDRNHKQIFRAQEGAGASGSFFFFSYDHRFIIKTLAQDEVKLMDDIIVDYMNHLLDMDN